jgi:hypothetical protein
VPDEWLKRLVRYGNSLDRNCRLWHAVKERGEAEGSRLFRVACRAKTKAHRDQVRLRQCSPHWSLRATFVGLADECARLRRERHDLANRLQAMEYRAAARGPTP